MSMNMAVPDVEIRMTMEVRDNWYAIRAFDGRLLAVGVYLPAPAEGIVTKPIDTATARVLLAQLAERSHGSQVVGYLEGRG